MLFSFSNLSTILFLHYQNFLHYEEPYKGQLFQLHREWKKSAVSFQKMFFGNEMALGTMVTENRFISFQ